MKTLYYFLLPIVLLSACIKSQPIPASELPGIWKLNGYQSTNYKIEINSNGYLYWFNYMDQYNYSKEFEWEYDIDDNCLKLYNPGGRYAQYTLHIYKYKNSPLQFTVPNQSYDLDGNLTTTYDTYRKMN
ncbi:MAG: hypothetical protein JNJ58_07825 [Chitinophagaceae bacterium]|nr:hypothetical protein [Chitinophagaceae bacterium]